MDRCSRAVRSTWLLQVLLHSMMRLPSPFHHTLQSWLCHEVSFVPLALCCWVFMGKALFGHASCSIFPLCTWPPAATGVRGNVLLVELLWLNHTPCPKPTLIHES